MSIAQVQEVLAEMSVEDKRDEIMATVSYYLEKQGRSPLFECLDDNLYDGLQADILRILL